MPDALPRAQSVHIDSRVLLFTLAASVLAGIFFGLGAGAGNFPRGPARDAERRGPRVERRAAPAARVFRGRRNGDGAGVTGGRGADDPQPWPSSGASIRDSIRTTRSLSPCLIPRLRARRPMPFALPLRQLQDTVAAVPGVEAASLSAGGTAHVRRFRAAVLD